MQVIVQPLESEATINVYRNENATIHEYFKGLHRYS